MLAAGRWSPASATGVPEFVAAAADQAEQHLVLLQPPLHQRATGALADRLLEVVAPEMARVRFVSGGSEANETALQLARLYHVERGRRRALAGDLAGAVLPRLHDGNARADRPRTSRTLRAYLAAHLHIPPSTWRFDPTGEAALAELDRLARGGRPETIAAFLCEPVSAAALPGSRRPDRFWEGLEERRDEHGFLICFDEVVTGIGPRDRGSQRTRCRSSRTSSRSARVSAPGHAPLGAVLCRQHVYDAIDQGSREFDLGHTWDGAPLRARSGSPCSTSWSSGAGRARPRSRPEPAGGARGRARGLRRSSARFAGAGSSSGSSSSTRATASRSCPSS